ncbi:hypothetical protein PRUPE_3G173000 [Prunus persica]|uniref:Uncharacterized protein n=1 Tax=Prunus persica TaxID=3760 RepID=M5XAX2_PRUPE|nr:hypothetical protein PRUPE_3G173000 [Prunus persica]
MSWVFKIPFANMILRVHMAKMPCWVIGLQGCLRREKNSRLYRRETNRIVMFIVGRCCHIPKNFVLN